MPDGAIHAPHRPNRFSRAKPAFARLEERLLLAAQPVVEVQDQTVQLGNQATLTVTFDNQPDAAPGGDVGYAPYVDLVLPKNGADGAGPGSAPANDGVSFVAASYLGAAIDTTVIEFDANGQAIHPFAKDASGKPLVVRAADFGAAAGDELVVLRLPFGSFVADQPAAALSVTVQLSPLADLGTPLAVAAVGGFAFGLDPLNDPLADPPIRGAIDTAAITPSLFSVNKSFSGSEGETATGPNFPRAYTISFDLAAGQTVTNAVLRDVLPDGIVVTAPPTLSGVAGAATYDPLTHTLTATLAGSVTGIAGAEVVVTLPFYVGEFLAPGQPATPVLDPATGAFRTIQNNVSAQADWIPLDGRDPQQVIVYDPPGPESVFTAKSIAVQKSQAVAIDINAPGLGPGDTVEYTIRGQVSDYFSFGQLVVTDVLSDGQTFLPGTATLAVTEAGGSLGSGVFTDLAFSRDAATGQTTIDFDLSGQLLANGAPDGVLTGSALDGPATFTITFRTVVDRFLLGTGAAVGQGDGISNTVSVGGDVVGPGGTVTGSAADSSASGATIPTGLLSKEVYALNGTILAPGAAVSITSGDEVTYRLTYALPQTLAAQLDLRDFLPLPVFDVSTFTLALQDEVSSAAPALNTAKWGPLAGGFDSLLTTAPTVTLDTASNSLTFTFTNLQPTPPVPTVADVLFTLKVGDKPFGDGLLLTNQVQGTETSASGTTTEANAIRQVTLNEPALDLTKGVVAFDGSPGLVAPSPVGPVAFTAPGSSGVRFSGVINSADLAATPVDSDLLNMDAGDRVTFAIVVENAGNARNGAFDVTIRDSIAQGFAIGPGGLNLQVTDGTGRALAFTGDLFAGGITLVDGAAGAIGGYSPASGTNVVVITYDLITTSAVQPRSALVNTAEVTHYAALEGGVDRVPNSQGQLTDTATVTIADPVFDKLIVATSVSQTTGANLTIGETITFDLVATLREGRIRDLVIEDILPSSLRLPFLGSASLVSIGGNLFQADGTGQATVPLGAPTISQVGNRVTFAFAGDIVNLPDNVVTDADRITVRLVALADDVDANQAGTVLTNTGNLTFSTETGPATLTDTVDAKIVAPAPVLSKDADKDIVQAGDVVTYTVVLRLETGADAGPAFDVTATDPLLPGGLTLVAGSAILAGAPAGGASISEGGGIITVTAPVLLPGEQIRFTYQARVEPGVVAGSTLPNTVSVTGDSQPGDPSTEIQRSFETIATEGVQVLAPKITKTVSAADTSLPETGTAGGLVALAIGEEVTYRLTVTLPEAVTTGLTVRDLLPGAVPAAAISQGLFQFISATVTSIGGKLSGPGLGTATPVVSDTNGDGIPDTVLFSFGDVANAPDGVVDGGDRIEIAVTARVRDAAVNLAGQQPVNLGEVGFGGRTLQDRATVAIVEPAVSLDKTASAGTGDAGDRVTFTIAMPNLGTGPAYNLVMTDTVPAGFTLDTATLAFVTPIAGATVTYDPATGLITATIPTYDQTSPQAVVRYQAVVDQSVRPAEPLTNTASVTFTSSPGTPPDQFQRDYGPVRDSTTFTVTQPSVTKTIVATDIASTTTPDVAIGESVTYRVTVRLPESTTNLVVSDLLPRLGITPASGGTMQLVSASLVSIGANITGAGLPPIGSPGTQVDSNGDGIVDRVEWDFGLVANLADNVQDTKDLIVVQVVGRVVDIPANQAGDSLVNLGQAAFSRADGSTGTVSGTATVRIVEPELVITKTPSVPSGDAGDLVTYTLRVNHVAAPGSPASGSDAYGVLVDDLLAPGLALVAGSVTASIPGASVLLGNAAGDTQVRVALSQYARLPDAPLVITYQARLTDAVRAGTTLPNTADLAWQSAPVDFPEARQDTASANAAVAVVFPTAIDKAVTGSSLPETPGASAEPGETVTYTITLTFGEGTQQVLLTDTLPAGLGFVSGQVTAIGANISNSLLGLGAAPVVSGQALSFDFGNAVVNAGDNALDARDRIVVQVVARVLDIPGNQPGTVLTNKAGFTTDTGTLTDSAPVTVVSPAPVISKDASVATGDAGDLVTFTVVVGQQPGATGPLYDLTVQDLLPASYVLVGGSATATRGTVTETGNGVTLTLGGVALLPTDNPATPGVDESRITLTYQARLADSVQPGQTLLNTAGFTGSSAPSGTPGARPFGGSDGASVAVVMPVALEKAIVATSLPGTPGASVSVGETLTYRLTATLSEGTQTLRITDTLSDGLEVLSASVAAVGAGITAGAPVVTVTGQAVLFDFGTVVNAGNTIAGDGTVAVEILARVLDVPGNANGTALDNAGRVTIASPDNPGVAGGTETATDTTRATVVAPVLVIDKSAPPAFVNPGETLTYTVTLAHAAGSTAPAYDIALADLIADPNLRLVAGSVTASLGSVATGNAPGDTTIRVTLSELDPGRALTVTFEVQVLATTPPATTVANTATADFDSAGGPGGRPGSVTDGTTVPVAPSLGKVILSTSNPDTGSGQFDPAVPDLAVGESLTYRLVITLPQGTTSNLVLSDVLPPGLQPLAARVASVGSGLTSATPAISITGQAVRLDFGTVSNGSAATVGPEDVITVEVDARVVDIPGLAAGAALVNAASLGFIIGDRSGSLTANAPAELVDPALTIDKVVNRASGDAGDLFTYTVTVAQAASSSAAAYDIVVTDTLDPRLVLVSATSSVGKVSTSGQSVTLGIPRLLLGDPAATLTYTVRMADTVEPGQVIGNTAAVGWDSSPGDGGRPGSASDSTQVAAGFTLGLDKTIYATSLPETTAGRIQPGVTDLAVGEEVTYQIVARLSEGTQRLVLTDAIPAGLLPLTTGTAVITTGGSISAGAGGTLAPKADISGQTVSFDFGTLVNRGDNVQDDGDLVTIRITARVQDAPINVEGRIVRNEATGTVSAPSDPQAPGITATGSIPAAIVIPRFDLDKSVNRSGGDAGDVFTYTLVLSREAGNTGPAYNLLIEDPLPALLRAIPGSITTTLGTASLAGNTIRLEIPVLPADAATVTVTYHAAFTDAIEPGQVVPNTATFAYASAPDEGRTFGTEASASVRGDFTLALQKDVVATSLPETGSAFFNPALQDVAAGETVTYRLTATLSEGTQRLLIADSLPAGLTAESARLVSIAPGITAAAPVIALSAGSVSFDFGTVVNTGNNAGGDLVVVEVTARVGPGAPAPGTVLANTAGATVTAPSDPAAPGGTITGSATAAVEAVAAALVFDKQVGASVVSLGDVTSYTLVLGHAANSTAPAYGVVLSDPISDSALQLVVGSVIASAGTVTQGNAGGDTGVTVTLPILLPGETLSVTFLVRTVGVPVAGGIAPNTAEFSSGSAPGLLPQGFGQALSGQDTAQLRIVTGGTPILGALLPGLEDSLRRLIFTAPQAPIILTGTAQAAATVTLGLGGWGEGSNSISATLADIGGNWLARLQERIEPRFDEAAFQELREAVGREPAQGGAPPAPAPLNPQPAPGVDPFTVRAATTVSGSDVTGQLATPVTATFNGAVTPGGYFTGAAGALGGAATQPGLARGAEAAAGAGLAFNAYAVDFLAAQVRPAALNR